MASLNANLTYPKLSLTLTNHNTQIKNKQLKHLCISVFKHVVVHSCTCAVWVWLTVWIRVRVRVRKVLVIVYTCNW